MYSSADTEDNEPEITNIKNKIKNFIYLRKQLVYFTI
jgi:hypothetical protein